MPKLKNVLILLFIGVFVLSSRGLAFASNDPTISDIVLTDLSIRNYLNNVSISFFEGKNNENLITLNQDRHWLPASTVKTFAALYAFEQISQGKLDINSQYKIDPVNVVPTELETPELPELMAGDYVSLDRLIRQMIVQSDNTAFNVMLDILGRKNVTDYIHKIGLVHSAVGSKLNQDDSQQQTEFDIQGYGINTTTAEDYSKAFVLIKDKKVPGADKLYSIFKNQKINNMIPLFLPKNVVVAHKHGDLDPLFHDGGIVSSPKRSYVLSIFSNLGDPSVVAHISQIIYTKDLALIGAKIPKNISEIPNNYIDPLILSQTEQNVLGAADQNIESLPITASDLGIKASDLLISKSNQQPQLTISKDSSFSFAQPILQIIQDGLNPVGSLNSDLSSAGKLLSQKKTKEATEVLQNLDLKLSQFVKSDDMSDPQTQTDIQEISNTRFSLLGKALSQTENLEAKKDLIKIIAKEASLEVSAIQPAIPKAITSSNLSQKPLLGEVINVTSNAVIVRSAGGQTVEIPSGTIVKTRSTTDNKVKDTKITDILPGTSVALLGTSDGGRFIPSFVLTKLDRQLIAPQPVSVVKVDPKNKVMVVSENGNPVQVNISSQTIIKGSGTNVSLNSIKTGDTVIIRGQKISIPKPEQIKELPNQKEQENSKQNTPSNSSEPVINKGPAQPGEPNKAQQPLQTQPQPSIIQGTSIQVIEKKQNVKVEAPKAPPAVSSPKKEEPKKQPQKEEHKEKKER